MGKWDNVNSQIQAAVSVGNFQRALEILVVGYQDGMVAFCASMVGDPADGAEIAQEVFLAAFQALPNFQWKSSVTTWLFHIAHNQCLKYRQRTRRQRRIVDDHRGEVIDAVHPGPPVSPEDKLVEVEKDSREEKQRELVPQNLQRLKRREREILTMYYIADMSIAEIANKLWISETTARRRLRGAEQQLKQIYVKDLVDHDVS
jgi:RNA polymerase sigma-70 factor (ECF subfamily)